MEINVIPGKQTEHSEEIWRIFHSVIGSGGSFVFPADTGRDEALAYWFTPTHQVYVAVDASSRVLGSYFIQPNQPGLGNHVANAAYMVSPSARGQGLGSLMCRHSLAEARRAGYLAMQFNIVVSTNVSAVALWEKHGFRIIGTTPKAYRHSELGLVDAYIMYREL